MCKKIAVFLCLSVLLFLFASCADNGSGDAKDDIPFSLSREDFSEKEIEIVEKLTRKSFDQIEKSDIDRIKSIGIMGSNVSRSADSVAFSKDGYLYGGEIHPYENDLGEHLDVLGIFYNVERLGIYFCPNLTDVGFLENLPNLSELRIDLSGVSDLSVLEKLDNLTTLTIHASPVETIAISKSNKLKNLIISNGKIDSLKPFEHLTEIKYFDINYNQTEIKNTEVICNMGKLESLELTAPAFSTDFLAGLKTYSLYHISLGGYDGIKLDGIIPFSENLTSFWLIESNNTNLQPLDSLSSLCKIKVVRSADCISGVRTTEGAANYTYTDASHDMFDWYYEK